ncbi:MAG: transketolase C-terminal domain-containing protein, partial [Melioribacter sp.]|nr:transketolase C-terminal domain-containing protein [Melioribacter sp.]
ERVKIALSWQIICNGPINTFKFLLYIKSSIICTKFHTKNYKNIFVLEDHSIIGGLGERILDALADIHHFQAKRFDIIGLDDYPECGTPQEVLQYHGLDGMSIAKRISNIDNLDNIFHRDEDKNYNDSAPQ